ncbi:hypothetical protein OROGR_000544 [Orobanche gracilis]
MVCPKRQTLPDSAIPYHGPPHSPLPTPLHPPRPLSIFPFHFHIDCGSPVNTTDAFHTTWLSDRFFSGGTNSIVSEPLLFLHQQEKTLRHFSTGKKNCYSIPAASGHYLLRTFTVYDNYDGKSHPPSFDVSVDGTLVFSWRSPWPESVSRTGAYSDLFFHHNESAVDVCFCSIATDSPIIGSLELSQIDPKAYASVFIKNPTKQVLINYGRFSSGTDQWGPGFTNDTDLFGRSWQPDTEFRSESESVAAGATIKSISTVKPISKVEISPNYFPEKLYRTAVTVVAHGGGGILEYELPVDAKLDYLLYFHFAEIDVNVMKAGQRVFDLLVNGENVHRVDVFDMVGGFAAYDWSYVAKNLSSTTLTVRLKSVIGSPIICGLENYAIVPVDIKTIPDQVVAMKALREALHVPERMGWNGDPCAPTTWDAWEGVTCHPMKDGSALVVSQIDLGSQGLKGYISDQIGLLTNLELEFEFVGRQYTPWVRSKVSREASWDLSKNKFTGYIPDSLTSSSLQLMFLNDNLLEGRVPERLYSIGVHGGAIDLDGNKGLCGVPSLPNCPIWGKHGLSSGGKVGIVLSCLVILSALVLGVYYFVVWKRRNDYDFSFPHDLLSLASKRNRYHRQKSLMALEMESQHAKKGFIPTYNVT